MTTTNATVSSATATVVKSKKVTQDGQIDTNAVFLTALKKSMPGDMVLLEDASGNGKRYTVAARHGQRGRGKTTSFILRDALGTELTILDSNTMPVGIVGIYKVTSGINVATVRQTHLAQTTSALLEGTIVADDGECTTAVEIGTESAGTAECATMTNFSGGTTAETTAELLAQIPAL
jgi:hypothetical protein